MQKLNSSEVKQIELKILLEFDRFCKENGLRYLLAFGTALGAARHGGFIPWDDDIDVIMPREDYECFLASYVASDSRRFKLTTYRDESSIYHFAKLIDATTLVYETYLNPRYSTGLWIDIFPIDKVSLDADLKGTITKVRRLFNLREIAVSNPKVGTTKTTRAVKTILSPLTTVLNPYRLSQKMDNILIALNQTAPSDSNNLGWACLDNPKAYTGTFPDKDLFPAQLMKFEGHELPVPRNLDANLTECYGDWRQLPPEEERVPHFTEAYRL